MLDLIARLTSPPTQTLTTIRPTPSTISFTVSTRPILRTLPAKILPYLSLALRVLFGLSALGLLYLKWSLNTLNPPSHPHNNIPWRSSTEPDILLSKALEAIQWRFLVPSTIFILWAVVRRGYTEESLLVLSSLGIQTSTSSPTYLSTSTTRFIPTTSIQDIFVHEAFKGFEVRFYLAIVVEGGEEVVVVFPKLLPRRQILEEVWRGARACLYEGRTQKS